MNEVEKELVIQVLATEFAEMASGNNKDLYSKIYKSLFEFYQSEDLDALQTIKTELFD